MNKHRRNRHLAIRNIQRTARFGNMSYSEARRKYKAGYRAIPIGKGYFTSWFLLNFGPDGLTLAQARKLAGVQIYAAPDIWWLRHNESRQITSETLP